MNEERVKELFLRIGDGDELAEEELDGILRPRLRSIAFHKHIHGPDLEDVVQEALTAIFGQVRTGAFRSSSKPSTWIISILNNKAVDHFRKRKSFEHSLTAAEERFGPFPSQSSGSHQNTVEVMQALARLTPVERFVLTGTEVAGLTYEEIAARLKCPEGTVASTKHRAIAKLRELLKKGGGQRPALGGGGSEDV